MALFCVISANSGSSRVHCVKVHVRCLISWWVLVSFSWTVCPGTQRVTQSIPACSFASSCLKILSPADSAENLQYTVYWKSHHNQMRSYLVICLWPQYLFQIVAIFDVNISQGALEYLIITFRGGFRHVQHVRPNRGPHKKGAPTRGPANFCYYEIFRKCRII